MLSIGQFLTRYEVGTKDFELASAKRGRTIKHAKTYSETETEEPDSSRRDEANISQSYPRCHLPAAQVCGKLVLRKNMKPILRFKLEAKEVTKSIKMFHF